MRVNETLDQRRPFRNRMRIRQSNTFQRTSEPLQMRPEAKGLTGIHRNHFMHPVAKQEAPVQRRNACFFARNKLTVKVANAHPQLSQALEPQDQSVPET